LVTGRDKEQRGRFDSGILRVAFRPDGRAIVAAHDDRTIRVYSLENTREGSPIAIGSDVTDLAVFPDCQRLLASCSDGTVGVWDLKTGQKRREIVVAANGRFGDKDRAVVVDPGGVVSASVAPDGRRALFASGNLMLLWDMETGEELKRVNHPGKVVLVAFSPDGRYAVSSDEATVRVWELPSGRKPGEQPPMIEVAHYLGDERNGAEWAVVSPDGQRILACGWPERVRVFDRATGQSIRLDNLGGASLAISPDGQHVLTAHGDKVLRLWELNSGQVVREFRGHTELIFGVAFSPDGRLAYSTSGGNEPFVDGSDSDIRVWDLAAGSEIGRLAGHKGIVRNVAISPDSRRVLSAGWSEMTLILWDALSGRARRRLRGHTGKVNCVAFLSGGRRAVSGGDDATVRLWDLGTGTELHRFQGHHGVGWLAASPDGRRLLSSSFWGRELRLWDLEARKSIARIDFGGVPAHRGSFAPDGHHAVWGGSDGVVRMYRLTELDPSNRSEAPARATDPPRRPPNKNRRSASSPTTPAGSIPGKALERPRKQQEAIAQPPAAIRLKPDLAEAHYNLGRALKAEGNLEEAIAEYRTAVRLQPDFAAAHSNLGNALRDQGKLAEAIIEYTKAIQLKPDDSAGYSNLGLALHDQGLLAEAVVEYKKAIGLKPDDAGTLNNLAWALVLYPNRPKAEYDEALRHARRAVELEPTDRYKWNTLSLAEYRSEHWTESLAASQRSIALGGFVMDRFLQAMALGRKGDKGEARTWFDQAVAQTKQSYPNDAELRQIWTEAAELLGQPGPQAAAVGRPAPGSTVKPR
jgi:WD40 repeat protein/tetratricopeptide (TPR) repeat protein